MRRRRWNVAASLALASLAMAGPGWGQGKPDLTVALSSFSTETLDPALGAHIVKYYLSLMFDYLVGTTLDAQPSNEGGLAVRWAFSPDHKRWTFHLAKGAQRDAPVQECHRQARPRGDDADRPPAPGRGGRGRRQPRARQGAGEGELPGPFPPGGGHPPHVVGAGPRRPADAGQGQAGARGDEPRHRPRGDRPVRSEER